MKKLKFILCAFALSCVGNVCADAKDTLISFSTPGPDTYADGQKILDGEWYALVWSADGNFDGIKTDGTPVDGNDEIAMMAKLAKDGHCPLTIFEVDSKVAKTTGKYAVYQLDTRDPSKKSVAAADANGKPVFLNGSQSVASYKVGESVGTVVAAAGAWAASDAENAENFSQAKITAFKVEGARVSLTVAGMMPGVQYNVQMGEEPSELTSYALDVPKTADDNDVTFSLEAKDAKFFKVVREPLVK